MAAEQVDKVDEWLQSVLWENELPGDSGEHDAPFDIHRLKGRLLLQDGSQKMVQGVREIFEIMDGPPVETDELEAGKLVLIGRRLEDFGFQESLLRAVGSNMGA